MPYDDPDPTDPMTLHGVEVGAESEEAMRDMAACFIEEYARLGFDAERTLRMFRTRGYAGPYLAYTTLGEHAIRMLVEDNASLYAWRGQRAPIEERANGNTSLPVLD